MGLSPFEQFKLEHPIKHWVSMKLYTFSYHLCRYALRMRGIDHKEFLISYARSLTSGPTGIVK